MIDNKKIAYETERILKDGFYFYDDSKVELPLHNSWYKKAHICSDPLHEKLEQNEKEALAGRIKGNGELKVLRGDTFDILREEHLQGALVLNFADPYIAGGNFKFGVSGQEQSLCRNSTVYLSLINSKCGEKVYDIYKQEGVLKHDVMILSPYVDIIRNGTGELLKHPVRCAVLSVPAVNLAEYRELSATEVADIMLRKIRRIMRLAVNLGYENIVLGAWGTGAFGHQAKDIASYFKQVLLEENWKKYFRKIVFAMHETEKLKIFSAELEKEKALSLMECLLKSKHLAYFKQYRDRLTEIDNFERGHGIDHTMRVLMLISFISDEMPLRDEELGILYKAAAFHDAGRINGLADPMHGELGAKWYCKHYGREEKVEFLIKYHSLDDEVAKNDLKDLEFEHKERLWLLYEILKDADALDRVRFKYYGNGALDEKFLRLDYSKKLVSVAYKLLESDLEAI